jgi:hypothetical protein
MGQGRAWCPTVGQKRKKKAKVVKTMTSIPEVGKRGDTRASWHEERKGTETWEGSGGAEGESVRGRKGTEVRCAICKDMI